MDDEVKPADLNLDGREFVMESSTASRVDPDAPSRFFYSEHEGVVWGSYTGDTVTEGRFVGRRDGQRLDISFVHALVAGGDPVSGTSVSRIDDTGTTGLRLVEDFEVAGVSHVSICTEVLKI